MIMYLYCLTFREFGQALDFLALFPYQSGTVLEWVSDDLPFPDMAIVRLSRQ